MKHTPGPWIVRTFKGKEWPEERWSVGQNINNGSAICISPRYFTHEAESLANAELIARAPELLEENESLKAINKQLMEASNELLTAIEQEQIFMEGYKNGSASISEVQDAGYKRYQAYSKLWDITKQSKL